MLHLYAKLGAWAVLLIWAFPNRQMKDAKNPLKFDVFIVS